LEVANVEVSARGTEMRRCVLVEEVTTSVRQKMKVLGSIFSECGFEIQLPLYLKLTGFKFSPEYGVTF
jgi:hypothetical protein